MTLPYANEWFIEGVVTVENKDKHLDCLIKAIKEFVTPLPISKVV